MLPALIGAGLTGLGMALKNTQRKQNVGDQKELMKTQQENQMALNKQGQEIAQQNWDYTNAENQVKHYEKAGLNVGLMYGGGGQGGTLASGSGGSASGGQAQRSDIDTSGLGMQMQQMALLKAQKDNIEADTAKKKVEANAVEGKTPLEMTNLGYTGENQKLQNALLSGNMESYIKYAEEQVNNLKAKTTTEVAEGKKTQVEADYEERQQKAELATKAIDNLLTKARTNLTKEQIKETAQNITNSIRNTNVNVRNSITNEQNADTMQWESGVRKELQSKGIQIQEGNQIIEIMKSFLGMGKGK